MPPSHPSFDAPGDLEAAVLDALWTHGELNTPAVYETVGVPRGLAYTTILTILQRLTKKGLLLRRGGGRSHIYSSALSRDEFAGRRGESLAAALADVGAAGFGTFLAEMQRLDPAAIAHFRKQLGVRR